MTDETNDPIPDETGKAGVADPVDPDPDEPEDDPAAGHAQPTMED